MNIDTSSGLERGAIVSPFPSPLVLTLSSHHQNLDIPTTLEQKGEMPISFQRFKEILGTTSIEEIVTQRLFPASPHIFRSDATLYDTFRGQLAASLGVAHGDITIVGSAALGFSVAPHQFGKRFNSGESDVDVIIISEPLFEKAWADLLSWNHSRKWSMSRTRVDLILRHHHHTVYWGHVWPDILTKVSGITEVWIDAFRSLGRQPQLASFKFEGRLYKSWDHARYYHVQSLRSVVAQLRKKQII